MISLVIVVITAGIGGAFLAQALVHSNEQRWSIEADEANAMCDAVMERARQALGTYTAGTSKWAWIDIASYCGSPGRPTDGPSMKAEALALFKSPVFAAYSGNISLTGPASTVAGNNQDAATLIPPDPKVWTPGDGAGGKGVLFANSIPFQRGALYITLAAAPQTPPPPGTPLPPAPTTLNNVLLTVTATMQSGLQRQVQGLLGPGSVAVKANGLAPVVSNDTVALTGSITIDGRDYDYTNLSAPPGFGKPGIISKSDMTPPSNGSVGGLGQAPPNPKGAAPNTVQGDHVFNGGYPTNPDAALADVNGTPLPQNTLKQAAQGSGTYFNSSAAYSAFLSASGGKIPDGAIVYLDFVPGNGMFDLGSGNSQPSILVVHTDNNSGIVSEVHGNFTGLILADGFVRNNGTSRIVGMVQLFSPTSSQAGNVFGNGNAEIDFSSSALDNLPRVGAAGNPAQLLSFRRIIK